MRENADIGVLFRCHSLPQKEAVAENFLGHYDKRTAMRTLEENVFVDEKGGRQFLVVDNSGNSNINEMVYAARALDPDELDYGWRMGCKEWWDGTDDVNKIPDDHPQPRYAGHIAGIPHST